ncbi:LacI family DNA-binding transcriptional regulator [Mucilaginibacter sp. X5P1]|uniref:LacI family DNA-binding transcriptional regulator n=1 Tax=Mucilaginibacter sp. X5P1 TaxID=2723088 RepID=UPI0016161001|nr:LacI family DNA-binding transcriptional regulator [Mucilaginibacter sp. X5P1]MBB6138749.1 LacI family transcriptional regulator [Mucilaginibacter sp. X5P1]
MSEPRKEVTIYDIAEKLNISATTVSRGLQDHPKISDKTKKKILAVAAEMGYRSNPFASSLRTKRGNIIGVIVPRLNSYFMSDVIAGIEKVINESNYNLFISQSLESMKKEVSNARAMFNNRVDGLLVSLAYNTDNLDHFEPFITKNIPVIFFDRVQEHLQFPNIFIDNYKAAYQLTTHLIEQGCKRILHIGGSQLRNVYIERYNGYKRALEDHNLPFDDELLIVSDLTTQAGQDAGGTILKMETKPDAVFAANDISAVSCMQFLMDAGVRVPEDIAFAGFNNDPMSRVVRPQLTTIDYKGFEMGEVAAKLLLGHLTDNADLKQTHSLILRSEMIVRDSSKRKG